MHLSDKAFAPIKGLLDRQMTFPLTVRSRHEFQQFFERRVVLTLGGLPFRVARVAAIPLAGCGLVAFLAGFWQKGSAPAGRGLRRPTLADGVKTAAFAAPRSMVSLLTGGTSRALVRPRRLVVEQPHGRAPGQFQILSGVDPDRPLTSRPVFARGLPRFARNILVPEIVSARPWATADRGPVGYVAVKCPRLHASSNRKRRLTGGRPAASCGEARDGPRKGSGPVRSLAGHG